MKFEKIFIETCNHCQFHLSILSIYLFDGKILRIRTGSGTSKVVVASSGGRKW